MRMRSVMAVAGPVLALVCGATAVSAHSIDGQWCSPDGVRSLQIAGPRVVTSSGVDTMGDYQHYAYSYLVPEGHEGAGSEIDMVFLNDDEMRVTAGSASPEIWNRCKPVA